MKTFKALLEASMVLGPVICFIPQIYRKEIVYNPILSLLIILSSLIKLFIFSSDSLKSTVLLHNLSLILLHTYLLKLNKKVSLSVEIKKFKLKLKYFNLLIITTMFSLIFLYFVSMIHKRFIFDPMSATLDCCIAFLQYIFYRDDARKPIEMFLIGLFGNIIKLILFAFVVKIRVYLLISVLLQVFFDISILKSYKKALHEDTLEFVEDFK
ncbi:hypothetical protein HERIO_572 [Hepatospora eriocheir]|uniref:Uncharacterized protein n=1 Tax=Hepatospora eriocheir TaxID=1081669 RepID=A0A1X0QCN3_9MICR|nr:hypothetical protein HERIO_572 [Hepatospora eriocheir]